MRLSPSALFVLAAAVAAPAQSQPIEPADAALLLGSYDGEWTGRGTSRNSLDSVPETAACAIEASYDVDAVALVTSGQCATTTGQQPIALDGRLALGPDNLLTGSFLSNFRTATLLESEIRLYETYFEAQAVYRITLDGETQQIEMVVSVGQVMDNQFALLLEVRDPDTGDLTEFTRMTFRRTGD